MRLTSYGESRDLERIRYVAANYEHLQGLRKVPLGIFFLATLSVAALYLLWTAASGPVSGPYVLGALYLIVGGVLDHLLLVRTMKTAPGEDDAGAV